MIFSGPFQLQRFLTQKKCFNVDDDQTKNWKKYLIKVNVEKVK